MDNVSIYKTKKALKFIVNSKISMITIPPYDPSLNLVEKFILAIKSKLTPKEAAWKVIIAKLANIYLDS